MIIETDMDTVIGTSAFASDLQMTGFPRELVLNNTLTFRSRILRRVRLERDRELDVTAVVYNDVRTGETFTIFNT